MKNLLKAGLALLAVAAAIPAQAAIVMVNPSSIQGANLLFNNAVQQAVSVTGHTQSGTMGMFTGTTVGGGTILRAHGGQARVSGALNLTTHNPNDTIPLQTLNFSLANNALFDNFEFNLSRGSGTATGVNITLTDNLGATYAFNNMIGNGSNRFGFVGTANSFIRAMSLALTGGGIEDIRQVRLDQAAPVPEPASWALMIAGFGLAGAALRRRPARPAMA